MLQEALTLFEHWKQITHWRRIWGRTGQLQEAALEAFLGMWSLVHAMHEDQVTPEILEEQGAWFVRVKESYEHMTSLAPVSRLHPRKLQQPNLARRWAEWGLQAWGETLEVARSLGGPAEKRGPGRPKKQSEG